MAELREVIIGNIRLVISAGPKPNAREIAVRGEATIYDQNINATRSYSGDMTSAATPEDQAAFAGLIDRFIQAMMIEHDINQADINAGQAILDAAVVPTQTAPMAAPVIAPPPPPIPSPDAQGLGAGGGGIGATPSEAPTEPVATEEGEGTLIIPPVEAV